MEIIETKNAPAAIGPYSQAIVVPAGGRYVYCSGQIGLAPGASNLVAPSASGQAEQALANLAAVLDRAGATLADLVKVTIYLRDMSDFAAVNEVYQCKLGTHRPARATVAVAGLPMDARVEIDGVAFVAPASP